MHQLNLPARSFKTQKAGEKTRIFDVIRKKYVALTPEEWVRQHIIRFLADEKNCPMGLMSVEQSLKLNGMERRADIVVNNRAGKPAMIVECKAPDVKISEETFAQISRYNITLQVEYLLVTNGMQHYCCQIDLREKTYHFLQEIPDFQQFGMV